jgi:hypothetical protein
MLQDVVPKERVDAAGRGVVGAIGDVADDDVRASRLSMNQTGENDRRRGQK